MYRCDEIIVQLAHFTAEQRSLAWSPEPPFESTGAGDCRVGGNCGLDFNRETLRARWVQARHRWNREQKRLQTRHELLDASDKLRLAGPLLPVDALSARRVAPPG